MGSAAGETDANVDTEIQYDEAEGTTEITVRTDRNVALVVYSDGQERIYLPETEGASSGPYVSTPIYLRDTPEGKSVTHHGPVDDLNVLLAPEG